MFMIHTPQSVDLLVTPVDGAKEDAEHHGTISFDHEGDDVSKCRMIITRDDYVFTYIFNTRGNLVSSSFEVRLAEHDENVRETEPANQPAM